MTVTHPDVKRYFMTIPEAVQLVLQAATMGQGGEVFALDMGEPVSIVDLARDLIRLSHDKACEVEIVFTGLRPGEKLFEEIFSDNEAFRRTEHQKIFVCDGWFGSVGDGAGRSFLPAAVPNADLEQQVEHLTAAARAGDEERARELMTHLVSCYQTAREQAINPPF